MKLIIIDRKAWERHCSDFADFIHRIELLIGNPPKMDEWLDNEAVCRRLGISKRTLQSYRDTGKIPFSMIGHKCYYKESDIMEILNSKNESLHSKTLRCRCLHNWWRVSWRNWSVIAPLHAQYWAERFTSRERKSASSYGWVPVHFRTIGTMARLPTVKSAARYSIGRATYKPCSKDIITQYPKSHADHRWKEKSRFRASHQRYGKLWRKTPQARRIARFWLADRHGRKECSCRRWIVG